MAEPLDPATRPSRLPLGTQAAVVSLLSLSFVSGLLIWQGQRVQAQTLETAAWLHAAIVLHGTLNPCLCVLFGYLCCQHIRMGWQLRANLFTGLTMEIIFAGLILSGAGVYYAGREEWRAVFVGAHRVLGLVLPAALWLHWAAGQ